MKITRQRLEEILKEEITAVKEASWSSHEGEGTAAAAYREKPNPIDLIDLDPEEEPAGEVPAAEEPEDWRDRKPWQDDRLLPRDLELAEGSVDTVLVDELVELMKGKEGMGPRDVAMALIDAMPDYDAAWAAIAKLKGEKPTLEETDQ